MTAVRSKEMQFEALVGELFVRLGQKNVRANVRHKISGGTIYGADIQFGEADSVTVVEVKNYRYLSPPAPEVLARGLRQAVFVRTAAKAKSAILVMSCRLTQGLRTTASQYPSVEIWDAQQLLNEASGFPDLLKRLETSLDIGASDGLKDSPKSQGGPEPLALKGEELAQALKEIPNGRPNAYAFESKCIEALKYLFDRDLYGWHEQDDTEDGLHRRDLVCRILPISEVWELMLTDLRSRYVIFEFKNYSEAISQNEIVTTERYLYPSALRNLAIIISPHGCAKSARRVIDGAMREHGKLILSLTVNELADLLAKKDQGTDPNVYLFERVDEFLMRLGR
jgi:Restriction endonuclease